MRTSLPLSMTALLLLAACGEPQPEICGNGIDDDLDVRVDCFDDDCADDALCVDADGDGVSEYDGDCDDEDPSIHPDTAWHADQDGDGFGDPGAVAIACEAPSGSVQDDTDCDDSDPAIHPGADELCNAEDDDCDGLVDDEDPDVTGTTTWYLDYDGDGYGAATEDYDLAACEQPPGWADNALDCDDLDPAVDCVDDDSDGFTEIEGDCDDTDPGDYPGAEHDHLGIAMTCIGPGTFTMGSPEDEVGRDDDETQHEVTLTRGFWIGVYEVSQFEYWTFTKESPSDLEGADHPVEQVDWHEAAAFANAVSAAASLAGCYTCTGAGDTLRCELDAALATPYDCEGYRLLTEAEWEYAARALTTSALSSGGSIIEGDQSSCDDDLLLDNGTELDEFAVYCSNDLDQPEAVGSLDANAWGLSDLHGNVVEWCHDWALPYAGAEEDPWGAEAGTQRVVRGGSFLSPPSSLRSANRGYLEPLVYDRYIGLRLARTATTTEEE